MEETQVVKQTVAKRCCSSDLPAVPYQQVCLHQQCLTLVKTRPPSAGPVPVSPSDTLITVKSDSNTTFQATMTLCDTIRPGGQRAAQWQRNCGQVLLLVGEERRCLQQHVASRQIAEITLGIER